MIGGDRLPTFEDRDKLPYVAALFKEVLRWHQVTPIGLMHSVVNDDEYNGYLIPSGAIVIANLWCALSCVLVVRLITHFYVFVGPLLGIPSGSLIPTSSGRSVISTQTASSTPAKVTPWTSRSVSVAGSPSPRYHPV